MTGKDSEESTDSIEFRRISKGLNLESDEKQLIKLNLELDLNRSGQI